MNKPTKNVAAAPQMTDENSFLDHQLIRVPAVDMRLLDVKIVGTTPLCINRFSHKATDIMRAKQAEGSTGKKRKERSAKDFDALYNAARHVAREKWDGFAASAIRNGMISACKLVGFPMSRGKLTLFVIADGYDAEDNTPLVRIRGAVSVKSEMAVRNETGVADIRPRPTYTDWHAILRIKYDGGQFTAGDVINLLNRVGQQVGIGEGRPDSKRSAGIGWGMFRIEDEADVQARAA